MKSKSLLGTQGHVTSRAPETGGRRHSCGCCGAHGEQLGIRIGSARAPKRVVFRFVSFYCAPSKVASSRFVDTYRRGRHLVANEMQSVKIGGLHL